MANRYVYITPGMAESYALVLGQVIQRLVNIKADKFLVGQLRNLKKELESDEQTVECVERLPRHKFWGAGEPDCPQELKAPNGELHTMRCKVCGDGWRKSSDVCLVAAGVKESDRG